MMQALELLQLAKRHILERRDIEQWRNQACGYSRVSFGGQGGPRPSLADPPLNLKMYLKEITMWIYNEHNILYTVVHTL